MKGIFLRREWVSLVCCFCIIGVCLVHTALGEEAKVLFPMMGVRVVLDAGHGGWDPGKTGTGGENEKILNLAVTEKLTEYLEQGGAEVIQPEKGVLVQGIPGKLRQDLGKGFQLGPGLLRRKEEGGIDLVQDQAVLAPEEIMGLLKHPPGGHAAPIIALLAPESVVRKPRFGLGGPGPGQQKELALIPPGLLPEDAEQDGGCCQNQGEKGEKSLFHGKTSVYPISFPTPGSFFSTKVRARART